MKFYFTPQPWVKLVSAKVLSVTPSGSYFFQVEERYYIAYIWVATYFQKISHNSTMKYLQLILLANDESYSDSRSFHWEDIFDIFLMCNDLP